MSVECYSAPVQINGWMNEKLKPQSSDSRVSFFDTILQSDDDSQNHDSTVHSKSGPPPKAIKTAVVKPNNYISQSFGDFRSSPDAPEQVPVKTTAVDDGKTMKRPHSSPKIRRVPSSSDRSQRTNFDNDRSRLRRVKSAENRLRAGGADDRLHRPQSPTSSWSPTRVSSASVSTVGSSGSCYVSGLMLKAAPEKDRVYSKVLHIGDRVYVDMSRGKGVSYCPCF